MGDTALASNGGVVHAENATKIRSRVSVIVTPDRPDWTYAPGDAVRFLIEVRRDGHPVTGASVKYAFDVVNEIRPSSQETLAKIHTVPDPYYVTNAFETTTTSKVIKFVNLPEQATIRIYSASGVLVRMLKQNTTSFAGELTWDVRNRNNQFVASGVYFYHVEAENGESTVGRMTIVNYVQ